MNATSITLLIVVADLMLIGCGSRKYDYPEPTQPLTDNAFVSRVGIFKIGSIEHTADFGTITVPENRKNVNSKLINLPVIRIHARSAVPREPIFYLAGGPGQSNMNCIPFDTLLTEHDFVMIGYRGVDGSVKLDCPEVAEALKENEDLLSEETLRKIGRAWEACAHRFAREGIDWNGYTIPQTIEDLEAVRRVFKYQRINLQSESYGTRVAYLYGIMYPESIHRTIMIGVNPPGHFMWDPKMVDKQLNDYALLWSKDSTMSARCSDLAGTIRKVLHNMPKKWLFLSLNPGKVKVVTFSLLFHRNTAALVFDAYVRAEEGDYSGLALLSLGFDYTLPSMMTWGELASKAVTADTDTSLIRSFTQDSSAILGSPLNKILWGPFLYSQIPLEPIPQELRILKYSNVETLMLCGSVDFSDPPDVTAQELLPYLRNGKQILLSEFGHVQDLLFLQTESSKRILASYYNTGLPDTSGVKYVPMDFQVKWSLTTIMKTVLVTGVVLTAVIATTLVWIAQKLFSN